MDREEITAYLRGVPDAIEEAIAGVSDDGFRRRPSPDEWSAIEVCCHLRDAAQEEGVRIRRLVEEERPVLEPYDEREWARERDYQGEEVQPLRIALRAFWGGLAYQLEGLADEQWERAGSHPEIGAVTVRSYAELAVEHAQTHLDQLRAVRGSI